MRAGNSSSRASSARYILSRLRCYCGALFVVFTLAAITSCDNVTGADDPAGDNDGDPDELVIEQESYESSGTTDSDGVLVLDDVSFNVPVEMELEDPQGNPLSGGEVDYYQSDGHIFIRTTHSSDLYGDGYYYADLNNVDFDESEGPHSAQHGDEHEVRGAIGIITVAGVVTVKVVKGLTAKKVIAATSKPIGTITKELAKQVIKHELKGIAKEYFFSVVKETLPLGETGEWMYSALETGRVVFDMDLYSTVELGETVHDLITSDQAIEFDVSSAGPEDLLSALSLYLAGIGGVEPEAEYVVELDLQQHQPKGIFGTQIFAGQPTTYVNVSVVDDSAEYSGSPIISGIDVSVGSSSATATVSFTPASSDIVFHWEVVGTDGFTASGSETTDHQGRGSFQIPAGAGGVEDVATITVSETGQQVTEAWVY